MKQIVIFMMLSLMAFCSCSGKAAQTSSVDNKDEAGVVKATAKLYDTEQFHKEAIMPQAKAWSKVADRIYPNISDDTEALWAKSEVDSLVKTLNPSMLIPQQLLTIDRIQCTVAYGMGYFVAILNAAKGNNPASEQILTIIPTITELADSVGASYRDYVYRTQLASLYAYETVDDFMLLATDENQWFVKDHQDAVSTFSYEIDFMHDRKVDFIKSYKWGQIASSAAFFQTYCPMAMWMGGTNFQQSHQQEYIDIATWYDEKVKPLKDFVFSNGVMLLPDMPDDEFREIQLRAYKYRTRLIELYAEALNKEQ